MTTFLTLPSTITVGKDAAMTLIDPGSFRSDRGDLTPALYLAVGNGVREEDGISFCDIYRLDIFSKIVSKINTNSLPFGLVRDLSYDPLSDELLLIDGNTSHSNQIYKINYDSGEIISSTFINYGTSSVIPGAGKFSFPQESGLVLAYANPRKPLNLLNFLNDQEIFDARTSLTYYTYYTRGSSFYLTKQNEYSFLVSNEALGGSNILTYKNIASNLIKEGKRASLAIDLTDIKTLYRSIENKVYLLDRQSLKVKDQLDIGVPNIIGLAIWKKNIYTVHADSNEIIVTSQQDSHRLTQLNSYVEDLRIKPNNSTFIDAQVTDEKYKTLSDITVISRILEDEEFSSVTPNCADSDGAIVFELIPDDLTIRDPFEGDVENLHFIGDQFGITLTKGDDLFEENFTDKMLTLQVLDTPDKDISSPIMVEGFFNAIPTGTIFDTTTQALSFWEPRHSDSPLVLEFNQSRTVQYLELILSKDNTNNLIIKDENDKIIYSNSDNLGILQTLTILDFIKTPEVTTKILKIFASPGTKIYDIQVKISVSENLGSFKENSILSDNKGLTRFLYQANGEEGTELIKISAQNKVLSNTQTTTFLDNSLIKSELINVEIAVKETASSITLFLKNPSSAFSYSTLKLVKPPEPRPADDMGVVIDYPDVPVIANNNIIDSGSYITSITTSNNLVWILSRGGNASLISTNPTADVLDFIVTPNQQPLGATNVNITITAAQNFTFSPGTQVDFGPGIIINSIKILEVLEGERPRIVVNITVSDVTTIGPRDITITSGNNKISPLSNRFEVLPQSIAAVSPINFVAESPVAPRFQTVFINSASLNSSISWGPFIYIVDDLGYMTRSDNNLNVDKEKLLDRNIKAIHASSDNQLIIGTEQGTFYKVLNAQDPLTFKPTLSYINSLPKVLADFIVFGNKIIAIDTGSKQLTTININTFTKTIDSHAISTVNLEKIWTENDRIFVSDIVGGLYEIDPTDFTTITSLQVPNSDKIVGVELLDDNIYLATEQGKIYLYSNNSLSLYHDVSENGGIVTMSKYFRTLQVGTEYGRYIALTIE